LAAPPFEHFRRSKRHDRRVFLGASLAELSALTFEAWRAPDSVETKGETMKLQGMILLGVVALGSGLMGCRASERAEPPAAPQDQGQAQAQAPAQAAAPAETAGPATPEPSATDNKAAANEEKPQQRRKRGKGRGRRMMRRYAGG
jgi:hypothetical protein